MSLPNNRLTEHYADGYPDACRYRSLVHLPTGCHGLLP